jgi:hypothetical protein
MDAFVARTTLGMERYRCTRQHACCEGFLFLAVPEVTGDFFAAA